MFGRPQFAAVVLLLCFSAPTALLGQSPATCPAPSPSAGTHGENLLTPSQEARFGKVISGELEWKRRPFSDPRINAYPGRILERLLKNVPASAGLHPQIRFYDAPSPDAFLSPGGKIYISRQLAAYLHGEDDLAALLAHELGYAIAHQQAVEFSQAASQLLGVTDFTAQNAVLDAYGRLADLAASNPNATQSWEQQDGWESRQEAADRTALYLLAVAGYPPQATEQLFERIAQSHKQTGNWPTNLFQPSIPGEKRLVALKKSLDAMPAACRVQGTLAPVGDFSAWRAALIAYDPPPGTARLPGLRVVGKLHPGMPGPVKRLRFSPDGRYLLVQNSSGVLVFTTNPLAFQFWIDSPGVTHAAFSSDSRSIEVYTAGLRVEQWSISPAKRLSVRMVMPLKRCWDEAPSPHGQFVALMGCDGSLSIKEESTGRTIFSNSENRTWLKWAFSPDSRYFFATQWQDSETRSIAIDLKERREFNLPESVNSSLTGDDSFGFIDSTRLAVTTEGGSRILLIRLPSGKLLGGIDLSRPKTHRAGKPSLLPDVSEAPGQAMPNRIATVTKGGDEVLLLPFGSYPAALLDVKKRKLVAQFASPVVDVFHNIAAVQLGNWLKLDDLKTGHILDSVPLPDGVLGSLKTAVVSPDLKWLAISGSQEGGVFHLEKDGSLFDQTPQFTDAWFGVANDLYLTFPGRAGQDPDQTPAKAAIRRIDLETGTPSPRLRPGPGEREYGPWLVAFRKGGRQAAPADKVTLEVRELGESKPLWTRELPDSPSSVRLDPSGKRLLFGWPLWPSLQVGHAGLRLASDVVRQYLGAGAKDAGYAFQIFEAKTGKMMGHFFRRGLGEDGIMPEAVAPRDELVVTDKIGRTQVYSWKTGQREGSALGHALAVSPDGKLACLSASPRDLAIARLPSLHSAATLRFPRAIVLTRFSADGRRLFVLTRDQRYYVFDVAPFAARAKKPAVQ